MALFSLNRQVEPDFVEIIAFEVKYKQKRYEFRLFATFCGFLIYIFAKPCKEYESETFV